MAVKAKTLLLFLTLPAAALPEPPPAKFRAETLDAKLGIGYGVAIADVDGDKKPDILLADAKETFWYQNPGWQRFQLTGKLTEKDHVCIAACDIDADGKAEVVVGGQWDPADTEKSGAVLSLTAPTDRKEIWYPVPQRHEPTVHRMNWVRVNGERPFLAVLPLHGRNDNKDGSGVGVRFLGYQPTGPANWPTFLLNEGFHMAHNFQPVLWDKDDPGESMLVAEREGVHLVRKEEAIWTTTRLTDHGSGEVRLGKSPDGSRFIATVEPMHGNTVAIYPERAKAFVTRIVADETLNQGHALVTGDFLGIGSDQIVAGWREPTKDGKKVGIRLYVPTTADGGNWKLHATVDDNTMACEDMKSVDLNNDGKPDLIAAGRATKNLVIYWNETGKP
ncbi:MAG: VCBS repeat-containing protein [Verrucomicrobiota bacterium]